MQEGIRRGSHRIGLVIAVLCFLGFSLILIAEINASTPGSVSPWYFALAATLSMIVYSAFRLLGWIINGFFSQNRD